MHTLYERFFLNSKVYRSMLISYLIILLLPILGSPLILYGAGSAISRQMNTANQASLNYLRDDMDERLKNLYSISASLLVSEDVNIARAGKSYEDTDKDVLRRIQTSIQKSIPMSSMILDIYICFPDSDVVLSRDAIYYGDHMRNILYSRMNVTLEEFRGWLLSGDRKKYVLTGSDDHPWQERLLLFHRLKPSPASAGQAVAVLHVDWNRIQGMLEQYGSSELASFSLTDSEDSSRMLFSTSASDDAGSASSWVQTLLYRHVGPLYLTSGIISWSYGISPSYQLFFARTHMAFWLALYYILCLGLGVGLMLIFARQQYTPLQQLLSKLRSNLSTADASRNEYALIETELTDMLKKMEHSDRIMQSSREMYQEHLMHDLARGRIPRDLDQRLISFGLSGSHVCYYLVLYSITRIDMHLQENDLQDEDSSLLVIDQMLKQVAREVSPDGYIPIPFGIDNLIACLLIQQEDKPILPGEMKEAQLRACEYLKKPMQISANIAFSRLSEDLVTLQRTYLDVSSVLRYMGILGMNDQVMSIDDMPDGSAVGAKNSIGQNALAESGQILSSFLKAGKFDDAGNYLTYWVSQMTGRKEHVSVQRMELLLMQMIAVFSEAVREACETIHDTKMEDLLESLLNCHDFPAFEEISGRVIRLMQQQTACTADTATAQRDRKIMSYIQDNFRNQDMNISAISGYFDLSPSYLTRIVKAQTGQNALDYIHSLRIAAAKDLMQTTKLNLQQIAEQVGYGTKLNIIRAFKRYEGVTPTAWKDALSS
ncbi:MAG: helix-turn-helix transcriptional regulator [Clostridia bacterium]|nr:helix-turn-helix transcriptional regulator [Clostridia bacterium]